MLKIEVADFQDKEAFDLDLKTIQATVRSRGAGCNSIAISMGSGARGQCYVSRCLNYIPRSSRAQESVRHSKNPRRAYPAVKPCRPCRFGKVDS